MKISVCMATFNGEKFIARQIESILKQLNYDDEIIVSDDSSTDRTIELIENFGDKRIKIFKNNQFYSPVYNFENALRQVSGDIVLLSDQDDIWLDDRVSMIRKAFYRINNKIYIFVCNGYIIKNGENRSIFSIFEEIKPKRGILRNICKNSYMGCCMAFSKKLLDIALPFPKNIPMHDSWLGILGDIFGKVDFIDKKLIKHRRHKNNTSFKNNKISQKVYWRIILMKELLKRYISIKSTKLL